MVKFRKFYVTDGTVKAKIYYSLDNRGDNKKCVTLYERGYNRNLGIIFPDIHQDDTEYMTDYFDEGRVVIFENNPLYTEVRPFVEQMIIEKKSKWMTKQASN